MAQQELIANNHTKVVIATSYKHMILQQYKIFFTTVKYL
jgi:hypothetical protein